NPVHNLRLRHADAERHSRCNPFRNANNIRLNSGVFDRPPLTRPARAGLNLIDYHENAVSVADASNFMEKCIGGDNVSALTLNRLDKDRRNLFGWQSGFEQLLLDKPRAAETKLLFRLRSAAASAIRVGIAHMRNAGDEGGEAPLLLRLRRRQRKRAHRSSVKASEEADNVLTSGMISSQLHRTFNCFCTRV